MLSVQEFMDKYQGTPVGVPWNKELDGECVSLVQRYLDEVYGVPMKVRGHGKAFEYNLVKEGVATRTTNPRYGDLVVWGDNVAGGYGHVAVYLNAGTVFDQNRTVNGVNNRTARINNTVNVRPVAYIRMNAKLKPDASTVKDEIDYWRNEGGIYELNTAVIERSQPSTSGKFIKTHPKGTKLNYVAWGNSSKYTWFKLANGNFIAYGERGVEVYGKDTPGKVVSKTKVGKYANIGGDTWLFAEPRKDHTYANGKLNTRQLTTNLRNRSAKILAEDNGRVKVRIPGFEPEVLWIANSQISVTDKAKYEVN